MRASRLALHITAVTIAAVGVLCATIYARLAMDRPNADFDKIMQNLLLISTTSGALIATYYALSNNYIAWRTFSNSLRPNVLIQLLRVENSPSWFAGLRYVNNSDHITEKFNIQAIVSRGSEKYDLSDLFRQNMILPARDSRDRVFDTYRELNHKGLELGARDAAVDTIPEISYTYEWQGKTVGPVFQQAYKWSFENKRWVIH